MIVKYNDDKINVNKDDVVIVWSLKNKKLFRVKKVLLLICDLRPLRYTYKLQL